MSELARHNKKWTEEEKLYLEENWGLVTMNTLKRNLQRSEEAIRKRAQDKKLGYSQYAGGLMYSPGQVAEILKKDINDIYKVIETGKLKANRKKLINKKLYQIYVDDLLEFLKENQDFWDARKVEPYALGVEPLWLQQKREKDKQLKRQGKPWTTKEDQKLIYMYQMGFTAQEIADELGRKKQAIYSRAARLRERGNRKCIKKIQLTWTDEETKTLLEMDRQGYTDEEIAWELGRDAINVTDHRRNLRNKGLYPGNKRDLIIQERRKQIMELKEKGFQSKEIADKLKVNINTIYRDLKAIKEGQHGQI